MLSKHFISLDMFENIIFNITMYLNIGKIGKNQPKIKFLAYLVCNELVHTISIQELKQN